MAFGGGGALGVLGGQKLQAENAPLCFKQRICDDYFFSDKYPVSKSSLFSKDLHFPRIQNAFGCPVIKHRPLRPAEESEPFPGATETLLLDE